MIELCRRQLNLAEGLIAEEVGDLWEDWMRHVDCVLDDPELLGLVYTGLANRWPKSRTRGRRGTPAEVVLRLLLLKHMRNWSYATVEREVRANRGGLGNQDTAISGHSATTYRARRPGKQKDHEQETPQEPLVDLHGQRQAAWPVAKIVVVG